MEGLDADELLAAIVVGVLFVIRDSIDRELRRRGRRRTRHPDDDPDAC